MLQKCCLALFTIIITLTLISCSTAKKSETTSKAKESTVISLEVIPAKTQVKTGETIELSVRGFDKYGKQIPFNHTPNWKITKGEKFGTLNRAFGDKVQFTGKMQGISSIVVTSGIISKTITVEVVKPKPSDVKKTTK